MAAKKKASKKTATKKKAAKPEGVKVYFITEGTRTFLIEYLQLSPAGQYAPAAIGEILSALQGAGYGHLQPEKKS